jgi:hypothetical protein
MLHVELQRFYSFPARRARSPGPSREATTTRLCRPRGPQAPAASTCPTCSPQRYATNWPIELITPIKRRQELFPSNGNRGHSPQEERVCLFLTPLHIVPRSCSRRGSKFGINTTACGHLRQSLRTDASSRSAASSSRRHRAGPSGTPTAGTATAPCRSTAGRALRCVEIFGPVNIAARQPGFRTKWLSW